MTDDGVPPPHGEQRYSPSGLAGNTLTTSTWDVNGRYASDYAELRLRVDARLLERVLEAAARRLVGRGPRCCLGSLEADADAATVGGDAGDLTKSDHVDVARQEAGFSSGHDIGKCGSFDADAEWD